MRESLLAVALAGALIYAGCDDGEDSSAEPRDPTGAGAEKAGEEAADEDSKEGERMLSEPSELGSVEEGRGLELGDELPDATLKNAQGEEVSVAELAADKPALVGFYRGGWCAYCDSHVREIAHSYEDFAARDTEVILISADASDEAAETGEEHSVDFPLLSDRDLEFHEEFEIVKEAEMPGGEIEEEGVPSFFLFNAEGELLWQHVDEDITARPRIEPLLQVLEEYGLEPTA